MKWFRSIVAWCEALAPFVALGLIGWGTWTLWGPPVSMLVVGGLLWLDAYLPDRAGG